MFSRQLASKGLIGVSGAGPKPSPKFRFENASISSASTLVAVTVIQKNDSAMSFGRFVKLAIPFTALQIALVKVYVPLVLR